MGRINDIKRHQRSMPFWDFTGKRLVMSGTHLSSDKVGTGDDDIFVSAISKKITINSADYHRCIAFLPGRDILPVFTSDDKWVAFAHEEKQDEEKQDDEKGWAIYRAKPGNGFQDPKYFKPEKLVEGLPEPERLWPFPDGKQITFSTLRWSGDPKDDGAILIYTCDLDGAQRMGEIAAPTQQGHRHKIW